MVPPPRSRALRTLSTQHFINIGLVAAEWANLELTIQLAIHHLAGIPRDIGFILTKPCSPASWCDSLIALAHMLPEHQEKENPLRRFAQVVNDLAAERANVVHSAWTDRIEDVVSGIGLPKKGRKPTLDIKMSPKEMRAIAERILDARDGLMKIIGWPWP
jgi:hypothetical protein